MIQLQRFDLNLLKSLDALLTERNVTRAAERVFLSQPAMSGALKRLREDLNDQLLIRVGREMELTPLARTLSVSVREVLQSIQEMLDTKLTFDPASARRSFNLAMTDYASMVLMPYVLERLASEAPYISCHVQPIDEAAVGRIMSGDIDLLIGAREWTEENQDRGAALFCSEPLFSDDFICILTQSHAISQAELTLEQYSDLAHGVVTFTRYGESIVERQWRAAGLDIRVSLTAPDFATLILVLPRTQLIATVPRRIAAISAQTLRLKMLECPLALPKLEESMVWHPRASLDPAHEYIRAIFTEAAGQIN